MGGMITRGRKFSARVLAAASLAGASWLFLAICGLPTSAMAAAGRVSIVSGGIPRTAFLVQPRRLKQGRRPVIIVLRGGRPKGSRLRRTLGFEDMARPSGAVFIYPEPLSGHWATAPGPEANRDAAFIHDLIAKVISERIADPKKLFLAGLSTGGIMALRLACEPKNSFAGLAILGATLPISLAADCKLSRPLPFLMIAGTADPVMPFHGGTAMLPQGKIELAPVETTLGLFSKAAGCTGGLTTTAFPDRDPRDHTRAYLDKLNNCHVPVELIRIEGGGHVLPGFSSEAGLGPDQGLSNNDINGAKLVWDFFRSLDR